MSEAEIPYVVIRPRTLQPFQQRVVDEKAELDARLVSLRAFMAASIFASVGVAEQSRMARQHNHMTDLSAVLGERIAAFGTN